MAEDAPPEAPAGHVAVDAESAKLLNYAYAALRKAADRPVRGVVIVIVADDPGKALDLVTVSAGKKYEMIGMLEEVKMVLLTDSIAETLDRLAAGDTEETLVDALTQDNGG